MIEIDTTYTIDWSLRDKEIFRRSLWHSVHQLAHSFGTTEKEIREVIASQIRKAGESKEMDA